MTAISFGHREPGVAYIERPSAYVIVRDANRRVATMHTPLGVFLPGGGIRPNETPEDAAVREAMEEAGLIVELTREVGMADQYVWAKAEDSYFVKHSRFYTGLVLRSVSAVDVDHELVWMAQDGALSSLTHESHSWALRMA